MKYNKNSHIGYYLVGRKIFDLKTIVSIDQRDIYLCVQYIKQRENTIYNAISHYKIGANNVLPRDYL
jgi:hypothetical protein